MIDGCRRKVIKENHRYRCDFCNQSFTSCKWTYMISATISDFSDHFLVNFAREHGRVLMGDVAPEEFQRWREEGKEWKVRNLLEEQQFKSFNILVNGKQEFFNGELRMRYFALKVEPLQFKTENKMLLDRLSRYQKLA